MDFRHDINALRALAVIGVIVFHFNSSWLPGGFAGVDIFFVLSGYLMTSIIFRGLETEKFSLTKFLISRVNRIVPALTFLCIVLLLVGWFSLNPMDFKPLGMQVLSSVTFVSNIVYWMDSGYFHASSKEKWLLHTWSLSVEWQFYLIYPIVILICSRVLSLNITKKLIVVGTLLSFIFSVYFSHNSPQAAYYLLPSRVWEMLIGGVVYLFPINIPKNIRRYATNAGLVSIVFSYATFSSRLVWPGEYALIPVLGTCLILYAKDNTYKPFRNIVISSIGRWSYSIYLWHWPIVVLGAFLMIEDWWKFGIVLSIVTGYLSYQFIEKKRFIDVKNINHRTLIGFGIVPIFCAILGAVIFSSKGAIFRYDDREKLEYLASFEAVSDWSYPEPNMKLGTHEIRYIEGQGEGNILFLGASHIEHIYPYVKLNTKGYNAYFVTQGGCFLAPTMKNPYWSCDNIQSYKRLFNNVKFEKVVTSFYLFNAHLGHSGDSLDNRIEAFNDFIEWAKQNANEVYVILGGPMGKHFDPKYAMRYDLNDQVPVETVRAKYGEHYKAWAKVNSAGVNVIDPIDYLCNEFCATKLDDKFAYSDSSHLRPFYAESQLSYLKPILE